MRISTLALALAAAGCAPAPAAHPGDASVGIDAGTRALDAGPPPVVTDALGLTLEIADGACVDLALADRPEPAVRFLVRGRPDSTVEIWADRPTCGVEPFRYVEATLDAAGTGAHELSHPGTDSCSDTLLGGWRVWVVDGAERSASVDLAFAHAACPGARTCDDAASSCPAEPVDPPPAPTALDDNRCEALRIADERIRVTPVTPGDRSRLVPNLPGDLGQYLGKSLVIRARVHGCGEPASRLAEADALLREAYLHRFAAAPDCSNVNYQRGWQHARGANALREIILYRGEIAPDVWSGIRAYLECHLLPPLNGRSENLRWGQNMRSYLAYQALGRSGEANALALRDWIRERLARKLREGFQEWGSNYSGGTLKPILNLAELADDATIRRLATAVVDLYFMEQAAQSVGVRFAAGRIRTYSDSWAVSTPIQTSWAHPLFDAPLTSRSEAAGYATDNLSLLASEWSPLLLVDRLFQRRDDYTLRHRAGGRSHYFRTNGTWALASIQNDADDYWRTEVVTHDVFPVTVQGAGADDVMAIPFGLPLPNQPKPSKIIALHERSFAFEDVAFVHHGGDTRGVWTGGGVDQVPIRLYFRLGFRDPVIRGGWVFLQDRTGEVYVAWAPTVGDPRDDGETHSAGSTVVGRWVRSTAALHEGETAVLEVGDRGTSGSFADFQAEILGRNPRPRLDGGAVTHRTRSGHLIRFAPGVIEVDGAPQDLAAYPFNDSPVLTGRELVVGTERVSIDPDTGELTGQTSRVPSTLRFR